MSVGEFDVLPTASIADSCLRLGRPLRIGPLEVRPVSPGLRVSGRALPVRHNGTVADLLATLDQAHPGDVLVVDNGGRKDEACVGDLLALEAREVGLGAIVVWGLHRDTDEIVRIGLPLFSCGASPAGPAREESRLGDGARIGRLDVAMDDVVYADSDGVVLVDLDHADEVERMARHIAVTEREQAVEIQRGRSLRQQLRFEEYLARRVRDPAFTFREHLRSVGGAIEA